MADGGNLMAGKRGIVFGVANNRSIAWGITKAVTDQGAEVALTYQGEALKKRVEPLAAEVGSKLVLPCDVTDTASVDAVFETLAKEWGEIDFLVQCGIWNEGRIENFIPKILLIRYWCLKLIYGLLGH